MFLPVVAFAATWVYLSRFDGWGAWASAPLLLVPVFVSVVITSIAVARLVRDRKPGQVAWGTIALSIVAAIPALWFLWRLMITR